MSKTYRSKDRLRHEVGSIDEQMERVSRRVRTPVAVWRDPETGEQWTMAQARREMLRRKGDQSNGC